VKRTRTADVSAASLLAVVASWVVVPAAAQETQLLWGDTHLHTSYSPDAYLMGNRSADPDTAYRYAKGEPIVHPYHRAKIQIGTPLDFLVVSDHAEYMGIIPKVFSGDPIVANTEAGRRWKEFSDAGTPELAFAEGIGSANAGTPISDFQSEEVRSSVWSDIVGAAERHNDPGNFTAFIGWEWSSIPDGANLHRVVFMDQGADEAMQFLPYSLFDSERPEDLWAWLDETSSRVGTDFVAIPHNQNISKGLMFPLADSDGRPINSEYATARMRWETVVETTQIKGDSETHPMLSPTDEFADFETYDHFIEAGDTAEVSLFGDAFLGELTLEDRRLLEENAERLATAGDYSRSALLRGLAIEERIGVNPYKFGMIGSTDAHTASSSAEEDNFWGKMALDSTPETSLDPAQIVVPPTTYGIDMGASGLAAVWAEENTRAGITAAFKRREVYATSGPRIRLRFFGSYDFEAPDRNAVDLAAMGYSKGVPMGGDLSAAPADGAPTFLIHAAKDPVGANLDRVQIVKGWVDARGAPQEQVYDVVWSGNRSPATDGRLPPVGNTVDLETAVFTNTIGASQLAAVWTDPEFDRDRRAFYYVRVLQIPTPRHSLYDSVALGRAHPEGYPATIQERAYSSPIWYAP
jgi:hypothetical protein